MLRSLSLKIMDGRVPRKVTTVARLALATNAPWVQSKVRLIAGQCSLNEEDELKTI